MYIVEYVRGYEVLYIECFDNCFLLLLCILFDFLSYRRVYVCNNWEKK